MAVARRCWQPSGARIAPCERLLGLARRTPYGQDCCISGCHPRLYVVVYRMHVNAGSKVEFCESSSVHLSLSHLSFVNCLLGHDIGG